MPRAFDRTHQSINDHDPLRGLLDFGGIDQTALNAGEAIRKAVTDIILGLTGIDLSSPEAFVASLIDVLSTGGPALDFAAAILDIIGSFLGIPNLGAFLTDLDALNPMTLFGELFSFLPGLGDGGIDPSNFITSILNPTGLLASLPSIIALLSGGLVSLPVSSITNTQPTMVPESTSIFALGSIADNPTWVVDMANSLSADSSGAAKVIADGTMKALRTGTSPTDVIPVIEGKTFAPKIAVKHQDYAGTGDPIQLHVVPFVGSVQQAPVVLDTYAPLGPDLAWPGHQLAGEYVIPAGVTGVQGRIVVTAQATAGTIWWDEYVPVQTGLLQQDWVAGLPDALQDAITQIVTLGQTIFESITGGVSGGNLLEDIFAALQAIPGANVGGTGGPENIVNTVQETWNQFVGGLVGATGSGAGLADLFNVGQQVSSQAALGGFSWDILGIRNNRGLNTGFHPTSESNISLDALALGVTSLPTFAVTQSTAITAYQRISEAADYGLVCWQGYGVTSLTHCFVAIYKMDTQTGQNTLVHESGNIIGSLSGGTVAVPVVYAPSPAIHVEPGEVYGIEIAVRGAGTHNVAGKVSGLQDQPVYPRRYSSVRNSGVSAAPTTPFTPTYGTNVPLVEFGVSASDVPIPHGAQIIAFTTAATVSYPIPDWADFVDRVAVGGGGAGHVGGTWGVSGEGGENGDWASDTRSKASGHFTDGQSITVTIPAKALGGGGNGQNGGNVTVALNGNTLTATGGVGGNDFAGVGSDKQGQSPGNYVFPGGGPAWTIVGGVAQNTFGGDGSAPGGGGAGGNYVSFQPGGDGAIGGVFLRFRQA